MGLRLAMFFTLFAYWAKTASANDNCPFEGMGRSCGVVSMDSTGQHLTVIGSTSEDGGFGAFGGVCISSDYGATWNLTNTNLIVDSITSDTSGRYLAVVSAENAMTSTDYGVSWNSWVSACPRDQNDDSYYRSSIASDSTGQYLAIGARGVCTSANYGATWSQSLSTIQFQQIASDSSGRYLAAACSDGIAHSSDYGVTWNIVGSEENMNAVAVASDSTGQYLVAGGAGIFTSSDYGNTWVVRSTSLQPSRLASDSSGQFLYTFLTSYVLYTSVDYGATWSALNGPAPIGADSWYNSIVTDNTGKYMAASFSIDSNTNPNVGSLYLSSNYGSTSMPTLQPTSPTTQPTLQPTSPTVQPTSRPTAQPTSPADLPCQGCNGGLAYSPETGYCSVMCIDNHFSYKSPLSPYCQFCPLDRGLVYSEYSDGCPLCEKCPLFFVSGIAAGSKPKGNCQLLGFRLPTDQTIAVVAVYWFIFILGHLVALRNRAGEVDHKVTLAVIGYTGIAAASSCSHLVTILMQPFFNVPLFIAALVIFILPFSALIYRLNVDKARGFLFFRPPAWMMVTENDSFFKMLYTVVVLSPNLLIWVPLLILGWILYELKLMSLTKVRNRWYGLWTGSHNHDLDGLVDPAVINEQLVAAVFGQGIPWLIVIVVNALHMANLQPSDILSMALSALFVFNSSYSYIYLLLVKRVKIEEIPIKLELMGVTVLDFAEHSTNRSTGGGLSMTEMASNNEGGGSLGKEVKDSACAPVATTVVTNPIVAADEPVV